METTEGIITLIVLGASVAALVREWLPVGLTAILGPLILVLTGVLDSQEMWDGWSHAAVVAVGAMYVVSGAISRTGAVSFLGDSLSSVARQGKQRILLVLMIAVAVMSAFVNNTTVVLLGLPVVLSMCERLDAPPSRYLIPLSFASIFGGMMTLVGTSTNLVVAEVGKKNVEKVFGRSDLFDPGMWDFLPVGFAFVVVGVIYMLFVGVRLLPDRAALSMTLTRDMPTEYVTEAEVLPGSHFIGKPLGEVAEKFRLRVLQLIREDVIEVPRPELILKEHDVLLVKGAASQIVDLSASTGTALLPTIPTSEVKARSVDMTLAEVIVPPSSRWIGRKVSAIGFRARYGVSVIAVQRNGQHIRQKVGGLNVEPADMLLVQGTVASLRNLRASENLILLEGVQREVKIRARAKASLFILVAFIAIVSTGLLDIATGAMTAAVAMVLSRSMTLQEAFSSVDWNVVFLLAGFLGLGVAMEKTGLASEGANALLVLLDGAHPVVIIGVLYTLTAFMSDVLSNTATAALMVPIVTQTAFILDVNPEPFLMSVAFAASAAFLTPVGYQTNLLVFAPGGYRFSDFVRVGLPLRILFIIVAIVFIPLVYPFH